MGPNGSGSLPGEQGASHPVSAPRRRRLDRLVDASRNINSTLELDRLLGLIVDAAVQGVQADRGTLYLLNEARSELWSKVLQGTEMVEIRLPLGTGLAGHVAETGESVVIPDAYRDPRFLPDIDRRTGYRTRNMLCMPLKDKDGRTIGVIQLLNRIEGDFNREDEEFIEALSAQAAVAIENARMAEEMVRNERLSAIGRAAGGIVHDFKNPLATVRLCAESLRAKVPEGTDREMADEILRQVDRCLGMAQDILDFTRGAKLIHFKETEFGGVMESFLRSIGKDLGRAGVRLVVETRYRGTVRLDEQALRRAFHNIADNAREAMPRGGILTVRTAEEGGRVRVEFSDTGVGMPGDVLKRAGEIFFTHGKSQGTGLGLAMVRKTVEEHGGRLEIESRPGSGTTIRLFLPLGS